ncbi:MAG: hypothetical protein MUP66_03055 [Candidatus Nanohaloarchaeota archaeon QJJ-5]|nr:hypothetical protein [Candidatus Nanohaloarchaeota archaeon QJJ-5]
MTVECDVCGDEFDTERGRNIHASQVHDDDDTKETLMVMEMVQNGKKTVSDVADSLGWDEDRVRGKLEELRDHDYVEQVEEGTDRVYELTEPGRKHIPKLVGELAEETKDFVENVQESVSKHVGPLVPKVTVEWPDKDEE